MLFVRLTAGVVAAGLAFAGCSGGSPVPGSSAGQSSFSARVSQLSSNQQTFSFTGKPQTFVVPHGVKRVKVTANGASADGARGGVIAATIPVTPGESLIVVVGGSPKRLTGGFNGGADGGKAQRCTRCLGSGGAGASDIRENGSALSDRVIVAGGAGGGGGRGVRPHDTHQESNYGKGGRGGYGGETGASGKMGAIKPASEGTTGGYGGHGATVDKGGRGGEPGIAGASGWSGTQGGHGMAGAGGAGGINAGEEALKYQTAGCPSCSSGAGGGGGGGYFGGGGGGGGGSDTFGGGGGGGGGGGSSYVEKTAIGVTWINGGAPKGNGEIIISW